MSDNVVSISARVDTTTGEDTTVVIDELKPIPPPRVQLRIPTRSVEEMELHITLIEGVLAKCREKLARGRRNHRKSEAILLCSHELRNLSKLLAAKRR